MSDRPPKSAVVEWVMLEFRCVGCELRWDLDDLDQAQPDGHLECPECDDSPRLIPSFRREVAADADVDGEELQQKATGAALRASPLTYRNEAAAIATAILSLPDIQRALTMQAAVDGAMNEGYDSFNSGTMEPRASLTFISSQMSPTLMRKRWLPTSTTLTHRESPTSGAVPEGPQQ